MEGRNVRWPAEWEPLDAVWISWPHRQDLWQGGLNELDVVFGNVTEAISRFAPVYINAAEAFWPNIERELRSRKLGDKAFQLFNHPTNDVWCRDHGPIFVRDLTTGGLEITDWQFNAWGGKFAPWDLDNQIPQEIANSLHLPLVHSSMILEGGAIEGNGEGVLITTESVLLNENRNKQWSKQEIEAEIKKIGRAHV